MSLHLADRSGDRLQRLSYCSRGDRAVGVEDRRERSRERALPSCVFGRQGQEKLPDLPRLLALRLLQGLRRGRAVRRLLWLRKFN